MHVANSDISLTGAQQAAPLQLHGFCFRSGPFERLGLRDQAEFCGMSEIQLQAAAIFFIERKIDVIAKIRFDRGLRQSQLARGVKADFWNARQTEIPRSEKIS